MHVTELAINQWLGIRIAPSGSPHLLELPDGPGLYNHVGTIHASVLFALAEACSGEYLIQQLGEAGTKTFAVLRSSSTKFRKPATGALTARAKFATSDTGSLLQDLETRKRALVSMDVEIVDAGAVTVMSGQYDWFLQAGVTG